MGRQTTLGAAIGLPVAIIVVVIAARSTSTVNQGAATARPQTQPSVMGAQARRPRPTTTSVPTSTSVPTTSLVPDSTTTTPTLADGAKRRQAYWWQITKTVTTPGSSGDAKSVATAPANGSSAVQVNGANGSKTAAAAGSNGSAASPARGISWPAWEVQMLKEVNAQRAVVGAQPLTLCYSLNLMAESQSDSQAKLKQMTHTGADGAGMGPRADAAGYLNWTTLSENIGQDYPDPESVMVAWVASPDHLENMRYPMLTNVGFAESTAADGITYWTQDFGVSGTC